MAMQNIDRADSLAGSLLRRLGQKTTGRAGAQETAEASRPAATGTTDSVELSAQARRQERVQVDVASAREALAALPDVREDRVAAARARLKSGVYATEEVRGVVAQRLGTVIRKLEDLIG